MRSLWRNCISTSLLGIPYGSGHLPSAFSYRLKNQWLKTDDREPDLKFISKTKTPKNSHKAQTGPKELPKNANNTPNSYKAKNLLADGRWLTADSPTQSHSPEPPYSTQFSILNSSMAGTVLLPLRSSFTVTKPYPFFFDPSII